MKCFFRLILVAVLCCSCSKQKSTAQLADELTGEFQQLPRVIEGVSDDASAAAAATQIRAMRDAIAVIVQEVDTEEVLTLEQRVIVEKKIRAVQAESEYLLQKLSDRPELLGALTEPIAELGNVLEAASLAMKGK